MPQIVRVLQHDFPIEREYTEGHVLSPSEAAAMNQLLVENVRNNVYSWVVREAKGRGALSADEHADLTSRISEYADKYQFKTRVRARPMNPLDATVRELARQHAETWGNQFGYNTDSSEVYARYIELRSNSKIYEEARTLLLQRQSVVNNALVGLL
jgi:hypothetical protein